MLKITNNILFLKKKKKSIDKIKVIIKDIKKYGENALKFYILKIDGIRINTVKNIIIKNKQMKYSFNKISLYKKKILKEIYIRLKRYHYHNFLNSWQIKKNNIIYGQKFCKIENICIYIPGGNNIYPSSIFMNCIPSLIYNSKIIMITPIKNNLISNLLISISYLNNIKKIVLSGGVHTLSCFVYGTKNIKKVNKITGPGNFYITKAKKIFFGNIGIDMLAGPSELIIICDEYIHIDIIICDFFSQLEHDKKTFCYILCNNKKYLNILYNKIFLLLIKQKNKKIILNSINNSFLIFKNIFFSIELINFCAPEHLMICIKKPNKILKFIKNSGAIFINYYSSEVYGDYCVGPSHVIPTKKTSKFFSSLNINDFYKKIGIIKILNNHYLKKISSFFSKIENFFSHSNSSIIRK
ncbi:MAG: histidinol dehydrogenase [Candidatus Carsonella ruddii]